MLKWLGIVLAVFLGVSAGLAFDAWLLWRFVISPWWNGTNIIVPAIDPTYRAYWLPLIILAGVGVFAFCILTAAVTYIAWLLWKAARQ